MVKMQLSFAVCKDRQSYKLEFRSHTNHSVIRSKHLTSLVVFLHCRGVNYLHCTTIYFKGKQCFSDVRVFNKK